MPDNKSFLDPEKLRYETQAHDAWKMFQIMAEFVEGYDRLKNITPSVTLFGSARFTPDSPYYAIAEEIGELLSNAGYSVVTGGGPSVMEAANKGAKKGKFGKSVGLNIKLPFENDGNPYQDISMRFRFFFSRKVMLTKYASACVVMPGGLGTLDEMAEVLTLIQTGHSDVIPVILVGSDFWQGLKDWMEKQMLAQGLIQETDLKRMIIVDDAQSVMREIEAFKNKAK